MLTPDYDQARTFLTALAGVGGSASFATFHDRGDDPRLAHRLHGNMQWAARLTGRKAGKRAQTGPFLSYLQTLGAGVFITVNETDGRGARAENVTAIRALIADADSADQGRSLHEFIRPTGLAPSILIESGGLAVGPDGALVSKLQAYWRVEGCPVDQFTSSQVLLNSRTGCDPAIKDLPRVLRLPGFWHQKSEPRMTRIIELNDARYPYVEFVARVRAMPLRCAEVPAPVTGAPAGQVTRLHLQRFGSASGRC